jgi:phosphoglycolate phosphatase-like HAD superfamily hydrolase
MPWVFREILGRDPREDELKRLAMAYVRGTKEFLAGCSVEDLAVPGAPQAIKRLQEDGWRVAIATGGWRNTAELKLDRVGIDFRNLAMAYADDALGRSQIIAKAVSRAERKIGDRGFERVVYVGDAFWDVNAAGRLGYGFVGRAKGENKDKLSEYGARFVLADYGDYDQVKDYLEQATVPALHRASLD